MVVEAVILLVEVFVECEARFTRYVVPMGIKPEMGRWFAFSNILVERAFDTEAQIHTIFAFAVQLVSNFKFFPCAVAGKFAGRYYLPTAFVPG